MPRDLPDAVRDLLDQHAGVLTRPEALRAGLTRKQLAARLDSGRWQRLHTGVYAAFSGQPGRPSLLWAALLRAGPASALSHHTAAELDGLAPGQARPIHVTVPSGQSVTPLAGVVLHYSGRLDLARHPARTPPPDADRGDGTGSGRYGQPAGRRAGLGVTRLRQPADDAGPAGGRDGAAGPDALAHRAERGARPGR